MAVVLAVVNDAGRDASWRPGLLLVQGLTFKCKEATLRQVTEMNARPGRKQSPVVLFAGLPADEIQAACLVAQQEGAQIQPISGIGPPAALISGLTAESLEAALDATTQFGPDPSDYLWHNALFLCKGWPFRYLQSHTESAGADQGDILPQNPKRLCVAWGLSQKQLDAALQTQDELGADIQVWSYGPYGGEALLLSFDPFAPISSLPHCCVQALVHHRTTDQHTEDTDGQ